MSALDTDTDIAELVGPLDAIPCEHPRHKGDVAPEASVYMLFLCCQAPALAFCADCHEKILSFWKTPSFTFLTCLKCRRHVAIEAWPQIRKFVPIEKGNSHG
jgi:hypothetical protein